MKQLAYLLTAVRFLIGFIVAVAAVVLVASPIIWINEQADKEQREIGRIQAESGEYQCAQMINEEWHCWKVEASD